MYLASPSQTASSPPFLHADVIGRGSSLAMQDYAVWQCAQLDEWKDWGWLSCILVYMACHSGKLLPSELNLSSYTAA